MHPFVSAVILAAGNSSRMGRPKQQIPLCGVPVLLRAVRTYALLCNEVIVTAKEGDIPAFIQILGGTGAKIIPGGSTRQHSAQKGLAAIDRKADYIAVADGARPLTTAKEIASVLQAAYQTGAAALAVKVNDTLKQADANRVITKTVPRDNLWQVQTPQIFSVSLYRQAMQAARKQEEDWTDDCQLMENIGVPVTLVEGHSANLKITTEQDIPVAEAILRQREERGEPIGMRIGYGYDVHRLTPGRKLILGGVNIPNETGLSGHSDADVLLHAIADSLLGACALGDIGNLFPDTDEQYRDADSLMLLSEVAARVENAGYHIVNLDATVIAQCPKLSPYIPRMRENIAQACRITPDKVSVKATTEEGLGFTGKQEGIAASAVCTVSL